MVFKLEILSRLKKVISPLLRELLDKAHSKKSTLTVDSINS